MDDDTAIKVDRFMAALRAADVIAPEAHPVLRLGGTVGQGQAEGRQPSRLNQSMLALRDADDRSQLTRLSDSLTGALAARKPWLSRRELDSLQVIHDEGTVATVKLILERVGVESGRSREAPGVSHDAVSPRESAPLGLG